MYSRYCCLTLLTIALFSFVSGSAQTPGIEWQRPLGGSVSDYWAKTIVTNDNHLLVAGISTRTGTGSDIRLTKMKQDGGIVWEKFYGGSGNDDIQDIQKTPDGGFIFVANTTSIDGDVTGFHGPVSGANYDLWVVKISASGAIEWQKCVGGSKVEYYRQCAVLSDGSFVIMGTTMSNDGDFLYYNPNSTQGFAVKLSTSGSVLWKAYTGGSNSDAKKLLVKSNGNIVLGGIDYTLGNKGLADIVVAEVDANGNSKYRKSYGGSGIEDLLGLLETGTGKLTVLANAGSMNGDIVGAHDGNDIWVLMLDDKGSMIWQKAIGGTSADGSPVASFIAADSSIILSGITSSTDGDMTSNHGGSDIYISKIANNGTTLWSKCLGGSGTDSRTQMQVDASGQISLLGTTTSNNGDVSGNHGAADIWFVKLTAGGAIDWQRSLGGSLNESATGFNWDNGGFTILAATLSNDGDVQGAHNLDTGARYNDIWVVNLSATGTLNWQRPLGGYNVEVPGNIYKVNGKNFVSGNTKSNNGDVSGFQGSQNNIWVVKLGEANTIKGRVFIDLNGNGTKDAGEIFYDEVKVKSERNGYQRWSIPYNGVFANQVDSGTLTTSVSLNYPYFTVVPATKQSTFSGYFLVDSVDFALQPIPGKHDVAIDIIPVIPARPGRNSSYKLYYRNPGTEIASGKVQLIIDTLTSFVNATPVPDQILGDTLIWNYVNLQPFTSASINVDLSVPASPAANSGDTLKYRASIDPLVNDLTPGNNSSVLKQRVVNSYDPNDKGENHAGGIKLTDVSAGEYLTYVINFQNLGTDTAFNIVIRDTLDANLDWNTLQIIGTSHAAALQVSDGNKCAWTFSNIKLPYSAINEPASHGFIAFKIKPRSTVVAGDIIRNTASIYFDFNTPVVTNSVATQVLPEPVDQPIIMGLVNSYCGITGQQKVKIINLPGAGTTTVVKLDNTSLTVAADSSFSFTVSALTAGSHTITVTYSNIVNSKTTTASFTVIAAAAPNVNVSANILQITNLTDPVVVTASNAAGGGKNPLYTFAWNRGFTNIIQAEGTNNTVTISPSSFAIGDNPVYVRMKTSEACYTAQTDIDSITIRRDQATGIIDIDNPLQVITVYPNPFRGIIKVDGLSTAKTYTINIYNVHGQLVGSKRVVNSSTTNITGSQFDGGVYYLRIYDEKKKKWLGAVTMIKK